MVESDQSVPKYKLLPKVRKQLIDEFKLKPNVSEVLENELYQEPYNMIRNRDGHSKPSIRWSKSLEQIWTMNNAKPDSKGKKYFNDDLSFDGHHFSRRTLISEPVLRADLLNLFRTQFKELGFNRCYFKEIPRDGYKYLIVQVPV